MSNIDWFKFEDKDIDFPFYKKNPYIPKWGWIVLFIAFFFGFFLTLAVELFIFMMAFKNRENMIKFRCSVFIIPFSFTIYLYGF